MLRFSLPALLFVLLLYHGATLLHYPAPFIDEGWLASRVWAWREEGINLGAADEGIFDYYNPRATSLSLALTMVQSLGWWGQPAPTWGGIRSLSLVAGGILLLALYSIGRQIGGHWFGLTTLVTVGFSLAFTLSAHLARPDIFAAAAGYGAIACMLGATKLGAKRVVFRAGMSAILLVLAMEFHPNALVYAPAMVLLALPTLGRQGWRSPLLWAGGVGLLGALALYLTVHVAPDPAAFAAHARFNFAPTHTPPVLTGNPVVLVASVRGMGSFLRFNYPILASVPPTLLYGAMALVGVIALVAALRQPYYRLPSLLLLALTATVLLWIRHKYNFYTIYLSPALDLFLVTALWQGGAWARQRGVHWVPPLLVTLLAGICFFNAVGVVRRDHWGDYRMALTAIREELVAGDTLMAPPTFWIDLYPHDFTSWMALAHFRRFHGSDTDAALRYFRPDVVILDSDSRFFIAPTTPPHPYAILFALPASEMDSYLKANGVPLQRAQAGLYGTIEIWRLQHPAPQ